MRPDRYNYDLRLRRLRRRVKLSVHRVNALTWPIPLAWMAFIAAACWLPGSDEMAPARPGWFFRILPEGVVLGKARLLTMADAIVRETYLFWPVAWISNDRIHAVVITLLPNLILGTAVLLVLASRRTTHLRKAREDVQRFERAMKNQEACIACGYSLVGLPPGARCPECGKRFGK